MPRIAILGSGMAGLGAAHQLHSHGIESVTYEKRSYYGGHTASHEFQEGFVLDEGPHISFTENERVKALLADSVGQEYEEHAAYVNNYWQGQWIPHPAQCHLHGLPPELVTKILVDFVEAQRSEQGPIKNYEEWLRASYGNTFAETFPMQYTQKYHTTTAANMSTDWIGPRLYRANLEEVIRGAVTPHVPNVHYITQFRYPKRGGFVSFLKAFAQQTDIRLEHALVGLDPRRKRLRFGNGAVENYERVISSIPLPELIPLIDGAPVEVVEAAQRLACSEVVVVSVGIKRPDPIDAHWTYFYDRDIFFTRLSTPHLQSRNNVPADCACLMAECYYSQKYRPLDRSPEACIQPVVDDLKRCGVLREDDQIVFRNAQHLKYANVIFDLERAEAVEIVHGYLDDIDVAYCGRYGLWAYIWTDQAFLTGSHAAERIVKQDVAYSSSNGS